MTLLVENVYKESNNYPNPKRKLKHILKANHVKIIPKTNLTTWLQGTRKVQSIVVLSPKTDILTFNRSTLYLINNFIGYMTLSMYLGCTPCQGLCRIAISINYGQP